MAIFTCDLENFSDALHIPDGGHHNMPEFYYLLNVLKKNNIRAIFYVLGKFEWEHPEVISHLIQNNHVIKSHGYYHYRNEEGAHRKPYEWLGFTGGFYFRLFPYWLIKRNVESSGHFYIHPHDIDEKHPKLDNIVMNLKRHIGLKTAKSKLERLLREVKWDVPR